jgi:hypothetical protein
MKYLSKLFHFLASYGVAVVILFFLLLDTLFGTLAQVEMGLYEAQKKYFESFFLIHDLRLWKLTVPLPLPGGYLLMILLFINLLSGGIIRARKSWRTPGILISHIGILFMLLGGGVTYWYSTSGYMRLYEGQSADEFVSYYDWELAISGTAVGSKEFVIPDDHFRHAHGDQHQDFQMAELPFTLRVSGFLNNCGVASDPNDPNAVDGVVLEPRGPAKEAEQNEAGCYLTVIDKETGGSLRGLVRYDIFRPSPPWTFELDGQEWGIELRHKRYKMDPSFTIKLDKFTRNLHPGTSMASNFSSDVTKIEDGSTRQIHIKMNEPLRHHGYTFFQSSWGPQNAGPNERLYSVFSVVQNPADQWPKWACYIIAFGMTLHFTQKLIRYLKRERRSPKT